MRVHTFQRFIFIYIDIIDKFACFLYCTIVWNEGNADYSMYNQKNLNLEFEKLKKKNLSKCWRILVSKLGLATILTEENIYILNI